jgi:hypothetical protein
MLISIKTIFSSHGATCFPGCFFNIVSTTHETINKIQLINFYLYYLVVGILGVCNKSPAANIRCVKVKWSPCYLFSWSSNKNSLLSLDLIILRWTSEAFINYIWAEVVSHWFRGSDVGTHISVRSRAIICGIRLITTPSCQGIFIRYTIFIVSSCWLETPCTISSSSISRHKCNHR